MSESIVDYTLPGILHYLQAEWRHFERERNEWMIEKAELYARITLLEGERRGIENTKTTLLKRVKMLEFALRQERKKHTTTDKIDSEQNHDLYLPSHTYMDIHSKEKSRQILKSCLEEINYLTLPLTTTFINRASGPTTCYKKVQSPNHTTDSPAGTRNNTTHTLEINTPIPKRAKEEELKVPANIDEVVGMIHKDLTKEVQEKFNLTEDKAIKLLRHANTKEDHLNSNQNDVQPKIWKPRFTIKGHLDSVRSVCFHPTDMIAASGSDDSTVKIWNLQKSIGNTIKKGALEEADPSITFRGHTDVVTAVRISASQNRVYSSSLDSTIRVWNLPSKDHGPFSPVDPSLNIATYVGHTDAIWDFKLSQHHLLGSVSADKTIKLWNTTSSLLTSSFTFDAKELVTPTSLDFCSLNTTQLAVSFTNAKIRIYDIETGQVVMTLKESDSTFDNTIHTQINRILSHPTKPLLISGHEDQHIKFFDLNSGECIQTISGHLDAITSLDIDKAGSHMVSGGHDGSIRLWDLSTFTCTQEFSAHRRKGDEGVLSVQFHPMYPWMISSGADAIVKTYFI